MNWYHFGYFIMQDTWTFWFMNCEVDHSPFSISVKTIHVKFLKFQVSVEICSKYTIFVGLNLVCIIHRAFIKRSLSDGNILCESNTPVSARNTGQKKYPTSTLLDRRTYQTGDEEEGISDSAPDKSTSDSHTSYSRFVSLLSRFLGLREEHSRTNWLMTFCTRNSPHK